MKNFVFYFLIIFISTLFITASNVFATEHGNPDGSCDLLCEAEVECEGHNQAWDGMPVIFGLIVDDSDNTLVQSFCVYKDGLVVVDNSN